MAMDGTSIVVPLVVFLITIVVTYVVIRSAVLAALRMHRDEVRKEDADRYPRSN